VIGNDYRHANGISQTISNIVSFLFHIISISAAGFINTFWNRCLVVIVQMMRPQPLIAVTDVQASSRWYQRLLSVKSDHGGSQYERLVHNGVLILQLHAFEVEHNHGPIADRSDKPYGNGVLLWFEIDDFDAAVQRAGELKATVILPRHRNPLDGDGGPNHWEIWLRDPDGYAVVLASPDGTAQ
jgi:catechol 2,3-dioxygenase-like lactoylglutathione lyase family enzyme